MVQDLLKCTLVRHQKLGKSDLVYRSKSPVVVVKGILKPAELHSSVSSLLFIYYFTVYPLRHFPYIRASLLE